MEYNSDLTTDRFNKSNSDNEVSSSVTPINPAELFQDGYELSNSIITTEEFKGSFTPDLNNVEFYIYDANKNLLKSEYDFQDYFIASNPNPNPKINLKTGKVSVQSSTVNLTPKDDILSRGYTNGNLYAVYNFVNYELSSSPETEYYISEISSDRTEIRIKSNKVSTRVMKQTFVDLQKRLSLNTSTSPTALFDEFYISFGQNEYHIGVNLKYDDTFSPVPETPLTKAQKIKSGNTVGQTSILIKLVDALPSKYNIASTLYVATKPAESQAYLVKFPYDPFTQDNITYLKGPNSNLKINDFVNNSSNYSSKDSLLETKSTGSKDQLLYKLNQKGITLDVSYNTASFNDFVNFSSAKARVSNFVEKVSRIQAYEADIDTITTITGSNPGVTQISESLASLYTKIENEIKSFDGFDYYQYYNTGSDAYPKTGTVFPLQLLATQSVDAQAWIQSSEVSASVYDENNQNWLYYTIPDFIKNNTSNTNYLEFVNMVGQSFDEVWLYTKAIAEKSNTTNQLDKGVPLQLADDVITSLGYTGFGNNYNNQDNFIGLIGNDNGSYVPPTGSELINHYIAINGPGGIENYWADFYSFDPQGYVESLRSTGFPYPIDRVSKEIFKRLYHNMSYLVKKKGTIAGLRQLINIWGIPNTILRINEFGGKNKDEEDDYDLWYQRYSYAFQPVPSGTNYASASVRIPWQPLLRNYVHSHNKLVDTTSIVTSAPYANGGSNGTSDGTYNITDQFTVTGGGTGGTIKLFAAGGNLTTITIESTPFDLTGNGYTTDSVITITGEQINNLNDSILGQGWSGTSTFPVVNANLGAQQIVPDGLGFRFKTTGYPQSTYAGNFDSQSLFIKKSDNLNANDADFGIVLYYTGSTSGSYLGATSSAYKDYGEMRFFISGSPGDGGTVMSDPIYLPFFDKGWWSVHLQRSFPGNFFGGEYPHPVVGDNTRDTTYTLFVANKIYDGNDGNQIGFTGSVSISSKEGGILSQSINESWNKFSLDLAQYGAGAYLGGWGNTLASGTTGSIGLLKDVGTGLSTPKGVQNAGKNFSGSLQEFRYYSHDISQSVFNDFVMNPESIEGNFITGSESSFDIVNFRAPLGNELENIFTSSFTTQYIEQIESVHPAITGSSPLTITQSFWNPSFNPLNQTTLTSSYDVTYNANSAGRTYSETNVETYFLDQPSIGIRNRVSNKIKYSTNLNFGTTLSNRVSIQQDPPISQSYTDNINLLEVAFSPTEEVNDDIIQALGYGAIQEVIADPRFRSSSDDYYPGLQEISKAYFKKYTNRNQTDYLRLIKYFDDSLFKAIKNYVPARTSVSTGVVIKQHMLERNRYREPQVDIVTTQSYAPFNQALTAKNLELTGSVNTNQLWDPVKQETYYSSSDVQTFSGGAGGSVNQYNVLEEGGGLIALESDDLSLIAQGKIKSGTTINNLNGMLTFPRINLAGTGIVNNIPGNGTIGGTGALFDVAYTNGSVSGVTCTTEGTGYTNGDIIVIPFDVSIFVLPIETDIRFRVSGVEFTSIFEAEPLEDVTKDIVLINANNIQGQGTATIKFSGAKQAADGTNVAYSDDYAIQVVTIDPSDGSLITKKYCSSTTATPIEDSGFVLWEGINSSAVVKAASFAQAVNSSFGQGSGATTPTLTAIVDPSNTDEVILTQIYGGTDGNTTITYGSQLVGALAPGSPTGTLTINTAGTNYFQAQSPSPTTLTGTVNSQGASGGGALVAASGLQVSYFTNSVFPFNVTNAGISTAGNGNYIAGQQVLLDEGAGDCKVTINSVTTTLSSASSTAFVGGSAIFKNTFLNALKSVQTPIYVDYNFAAPGPAPSVAVTVQASSSVRGVVYNNTTTYTDQDPAGSILVDPQGQKQYLDMHPGEDVFISINSIPDITVDNYQIILGENILIATALAAQSIVSSTTLIIDNISDDKIPPVGSLVTGPEVKAGVVTVLGAVTNAGTGYDPSTTQVLATTGAGGNNLTLTVTTNASGNVTTAAISGLANPGTGYSTNDVVTIVGGDNNATVAITTATPLSVLIDDFDPTNNQLTFNSVQTITDNSKLTFTTTAIPNPDTIPVSQQGYFTNDVNALGVDTIWDSYQNQFYDGEYSGSTIVVDDYFKEQYNPYKKVKGNSIPIAETAVTVDVNNGVSSGGGMAVNVNTPTSFDFTTTLGTNGKRETYLGITALELIPYQTYKVTYTLLTTAGGGFGLGFYPENYGYNNTSYGLYPQLVSSYSGTIGGANTGYSLDTNVATTPPVSRIPTITGTPGTDYTTGVFNTTGGNGSGQTIRINSVGAGGEITSITLVNPGSGYIVGDVLTVVGGNNDGLINPGAGGVVVDIVKLENFTGNADTNLFSGVILAGNPVTIVNVSGDLAIGADVTSTTGGATIPPGTKISGGNLTGTIEFDKDVTLVNPTTLDISYTGIVDSGTTGLNIVNGGNGLYQSGDTITITGAGDGTANFIAGTSTGGVLNGVTNSDTREDFTRPVNGVSNNREFTFKYLPPLSGNTAENGRYSLGWYCTTGGNAPLAQAQTGTVSNITVTGIGGIYENVEAPIFLTQQDEGYDNQKDYQNMGPTDILGNVVSPINLIQNTQSVIYNQSDYNPLSNNVNINRSSSNKYVLSYGATQSVPNNFDLVVTASYFPTSPSGTFPELADVPDSNYTMPSSVNARYAGTKLKSLTYNFFTPSGSVGPEVELPIMPVNRSRNPIGFRVANEFLDGSVTSSFIQTTFLAGSASWEGDSKQNKGESTIDKHPIYMARFENSYEQLNLYNSYQFNIDQLIEVPREDIAGSEITPNSITIDGSNENKKVVSSVFEPKRKVSVSYLNPKTPAIDYTTLTIGNFDILSGATEFLTVNSNAKSRVSGSLRYQYELGGNPYTSSAFQTEDTIQMVTGSNTIPRPGLAGNFNPNQTLTKTNSPTLIGSYANFSGTLIGVPVTSTSGGTGATVDLTFSNGVLTLSGVKINQTGQGYTVGGSIFISATDINAALP